MADGPTGLENQENSTTKPTVGRRIDKTPVVEVKGEAWEDFLDHNLGSKDANGIKDFFGIGTVHFNGLRIEKGAEVERSGFSPKENKIELKEDEVNANVLRHELHHALVENKYHISGLEERFLTKFNISQQNLTEMNVLANKEFSERFNEAFKDFNKRSGRMILSGTEERLAKEGMDKDEMRYAVDYYKAQKLLGVLNEYREFLLSETEKKFGKEAAGIQRILFDVRGADEIIGHALSNTEFNMDLISYKFINLGSGSKDVFKTIGQIREEGYFPVLDELVGKKVENLEQKLKSV